MMVGLLMVSLLGQIELYEEGTRVGTARRLNCSGAGITCTLSGGTAKLDVTASGGGGDGGGAPITAQYWTGAADGTLSAEKNLGALGTGLVLNTAGTPSAYAGASCTNQFPRSLNASGAATCASVALTTDVSGTLPQGSGGTGAGALTCTSGQALTSNGTAYSCTSTLTASSVAGANVSGAVATATALAADPADCSAGQYATAAAASGALTCAQVQASQLGGTLSVSSGGTGAAPGAADQVLVSTSTSAATWRTLPSCSNATTSKLLYDTATDTWSCGTDQTGGGGGSANVVEVDVDFGSGTDMVSTVVTGQTWVTSTSKILCGPTLVATSSRAEGEEDAVIEGLVPAIHSRVAGTGFTLVVAVPLGVASGVFKFHCTGA
jgi:hypothetical protein